MIRLFLAIVMVAVVAGFVFMPHKHQGVNLVTPITNVGSSNTGWNCSSDTAMKPSFTSEGDALRVDIPQIDGKDYDVQCFYAGVKAKEGAQYKLSFEAKASQEDVVHLQAVAETRGFPSIGLDTPVPLVTKWVQYSYTFTAQGLNGRTAHIPLFMLGTSTGTVWIRKVVVEEL
jgi:hypothetical protein